MNLINYFEQYFWKDLKSIPTSRPNNTLLENPEGFFVHKEILFYGGDNWDNYNDDITLIGIGKREKFILTLFVISTIDYYIKNNIKLYSIVYQPYDPPKLGFCGYGPHFEHPFTILKKWIKNNEIDYDLSNIKELFEYIVSKHPNIDIDDFKKLIINNITNIPNKFNHSVFFNFLDEKNLFNWKKTVSTLLN